jgi:hypothetical protein
MESSEPTPHPEALRPGTRVERVNSPADSNVPDGTRGVIVAVYATESEPDRPPQFGYDVQWEGRNDRPLFSAGSRLREVLL